MNKDEVLFLTGGPYIYGAEVMALQLIKGLKNKGYKIFCAVTGFNDGAYIKELDKMHVPYKIIYLGWLYIRKPLWTLDSLIHYPKAYIQYYKLLKKNNSRYVYHYNYQSLFLLLPFLKKNNIFHVHDTMDKKMGRFVLKYIDKKVAYYIPCSNVIVKELEKNGIKKEKIKLIYNGIDFSQKQETFINNNDDGIFHIGIIGQLVERKGHHVLLEALGIVLNSFDNFRLHIFGSGDSEYIDKLHKIIQKNKLSNHVIWEGYQADKSKIYSGLDFCIVPTLVTEAFGLVAVEPAVYHKPVIASKCGGLLEIVDNNKTGLLFEQGNIEELAEKIIYLLNNPQQINLMGEKAFEIYKEKFSDHNMVDQFDLLLQEPLSNKPI